MKCCPRPMGVTEQSRGGSHRLGRWEWALAIFVTCGCALPAVGLDEPPVDAPTPDVAADPTHDTPPASPLEAVGGPEWRQWVDQMIADIRARTLDEDMNKETADRIEDGIRALDQIAQGVARFTEAVGASFQSEEFKAFTQRMEQDFKQASDSFNDVDWQGLEEMVRAMAEEIAAPFAVAMEHMDAEAAAVDRVTESRGVDAFHAIDMQGSFALNVTVGPETRLDLSARESAHSLIRTVVEEGTLRIYPSQAGLVRGPITLTATTPSLQELSVNGANQVAVTGLSGSTLAVNIAGASNVILAGAAAEFSASLSGACNLDAADLKAERVQVSASGSCNAAVHAVQALQALVTGASNIRYSGDPLELKTEVRGVGTIRKR